MGHVGWLAEPSFHDRIGVRRVIQPCQMKHSRCSLLRTRTPETIDWSYMVWRLTVTTGSIPAGLEKLRHLKILNLKWNHLTGDKPATPG